MRACCLYCPLFTIHCFFQTTIFQALTALDQSEYDSHSIAVTRRRETVPSIQCIIPSLTTTELYTLGERTPCVRCGVLKYSYEEGTQWCCSAQRAIEHLGGIPAYYDEALEIIKEYPGRHWNQDAYNVCLELTFCAHSSTAGTPGFHFHEGKSFGVIRLQGGLYIRTLPLDSTTR